MAQYIDMVAVRVEPYDAPLIAQAPWCSPIEAGMMVICETAQGEELGTVVAVVHSVQTNNEAITMAKTLSRMPKDEELGKVISYFQEKKLDYDDE